MRIMGVVSPAGDVDDTSMDGVHALEEEQDEKEVGQVIYLEGGFVAVFCEALTTA